MSVNITLELEYECDHYDDELNDYCDNGYFSVQYPDSGKWGRKRCSKCNGTGQLPTELGEQLLEFIKRHAIKAQ